MFSVCAFAEPADWTEEEGWGGGGEGGAALPLEVTNLETEIRSSSFAMLSGGNDTDTTLVRRKIENFESMAAYQ
jgi:hypothetical protein